MSRIAVLPGDGIGVEVTREAVKILRAASETYSFHLDFEEALVGGCAIDAVGCPLPEDTLYLCRRSDAILFGAVGGPRWDHLPPAQRPEVGALLPLRKELGLYANLRPVRMDPALVGSSPLKESAVLGVDLVVLRELTGGLYFGPRGREDTPSGRRVFDTLVYTDGEIERILRFAFELARGRRGKVTSVDKANVLESSRVWRELADKTAREYPGVELEHQLVDSCAMQLIRSPRRFDVIVTENMFGDILTDLASTLAGSLGMLPSMSKGDIGPALFEPIHGSAPDIAGQGKANPLAAILSAALLIRYSLGRPEAAVAVEAAVEEVLSAGYRTADLYVDGTILVGTSEMGDLVAGRLAGGKVGLTMLDKRP